MTDKDIYFDNDTIKANMDLWNNDLLKDYKWVDIDEHCANATLANSIAVINDISFFIRN